LSYGKERLEQTGQTYKINGETIKARKKTSNKWFEVQDSIAYWDDFNKPKIVWAELSRTGNSFVFDCNQMFVGNTGYILTSNKGDVKTLNYLLGVLNSRIILYYLDLICTRFDDNGWRWLRQFVEVIPIPIILSDRCSDLITIVEKTDRQNQQEHSKAINKIVAEIYGLSKEEMDYINLYLYKY
jgi:hypothetical protein